MLRKDDLEDEHASGDKKGDKQFPHAHPLPFGAAFTVWLKDNWQVSDLGMYVVKHYSVMYVVGWDEVKCCSMQYSAVQCNWMKCCSM